MIIKKSKRAFTLIEVLISVTLLVIVGVALMQVAANSKKGFSYLEKKISFDEKSSIALTHHDKKYHKKTKDLYTFLSRDYNITDDELIKILKEEKVSYEQKNFSVINPFAVDENESETDEEEITDQSLIINVDKISVFNKEGSINAYSVTLQ